MWVRFLAWDAEVSRRLNMQHHPSWVRGLGTILAHSGDSWFWFAGLGLAYWQGNEVCRGRALVYALSILYTALMVMAIKFTVRRRRPEGDWGAIYRKTDPHSFPSGHAARAALLAILGLGLGPGWWGGLLVAWAPLVMLARVVMGVHYLSDVLAGACLGLFAGVSILVLMPHLPFLV